MRAREIARRSRHRFHGDPARFEVVAALVAARFPGARYAADVAGGQGMLARILTKRHGIECEVVDPRGWTLTGVRSRREVYRADMAEHYDVVVGLHPDDALRDVAGSASVRPVVLVPCCNFWDRGARLGRNALLAAIESSYCSDRVTFERAELAFKGPHNIALISSPPLR